MHQTSLCSRLCSHTSRMSLTVVVDIIYANPDSVTPKITSSEWTPGRNSTDNAGDALPTQLSRSKMKLNGSGSGSKVPCAFTSGSKGVWSIEPDWMGCLSHSSSESEIYMLANSHTPTTKLFPNTTCHINNPKDLVKLPRSVIVKPSIAHPYFDNKEEEGAWDEV